MTDEMIPCSKFATHSSTRKAAILGYEGKTLLNAPLLAEVVELRREVAQLLGFKNWAAYILQVKSSSLPPPPSPLPLTSETVAKTPEKVFEFLDDLENKLRPLGEKEKSELLAIKKEDCEARGIAYVDELFLWDYRYYDRIWQEKNLGLGKSLLFHGEG
jgi:Zn-dependent oligopeptidase